MKHLKLLFVTAFAVMTSLVLTGCPGYTYSFMAETPNEANEVVQLGDAGNAGDIDETMRASATAPHPLGITLR